MRLISAVEFIDKAIPLNEKGEPWKLSPYQRRVTVSESFKEPLIMRGTISGSTRSSGLLKSLQDQGLKFKIGARFDAPFAVKVAVKHKMGIGLLFLDNVRNHVKDGEFKILIGHGLKFRRPDVYHLP
jgi:hypothetical protein